MNRKPWDTVARLKPLVFVACLLPFVLLVGQAAQGHLGPDPAKRVVDVMGLWAIRMLLLCLLMTPLRLMTGRSYWIRYRRMLGLFALFYVLVHVNAYIFLLFGAEWGHLAHELAKRPYIIVGSLALLMMLPLGLTSTRGWQRRLKRRWVLLHKMIYPLSVVALVHFSWVKKLGIYAIWPYVVALVLLLGIRLWSRFHHSAKESLSAS